MGESTIEMATVLFTDLVGSTALRSRLGDDLADELRRVHDRLLIEAIDVNGGTVVKGLGDGILARFSSSVDALSAAVAIQRAAALHARQHRAHAFELRVGLSAGDISIEDDDVFGTAVNEAARLCAAAPGGGIFAASIVDALARGRGGHRFEAVGELELKGLDGTVPTLSVLWEMTSVDATRVPLPPPLRVTGALPFAGRSDALDALDDAWQQARSGQPSIRLLAGEPGAGKTRMAAELAHRVQADGGIVLFGHCDETLDTAFLSLAEALHSAVRAASDRTPHNLFGAAANRLAHLVPELADLDPSMELAPSEDAETDRYRMLTAIADGLEHLATDTGLLVVLDDLHWADRGTAQFLRLLANRGVPDRTLLVGTYRDTDVDPALPFGQVVADLRRAPGVIRLAVGGLDQEEVEQLLDAAAGEDGYDTAERARLAGLLLHETEGNPFFLTEVLRNLVESGSLAVRDGVWNLDAELDEAGVPEGVRDVLGQRLARISDDARRTLLVGAAIGSSFDTLAVAVVAETPLEEVEDHLDEAIGAFLLDETDIGQVRFSHILMRSTLYESMSATRRARLHRRIAEHLERVVPEDLGSLAHHWFEAASTSDNAAGRALELAIQVGDRAAASGAPDAATAAFERALTLAEDLDLNEPRWRAEVLIKLAVAERVSGGQRFRDLLEDAARLAISIDDLELAAQALLEDRDLFLTLSDISPERRSLEETVLAEATALDPVTRAAMLALRARDATLCTDIQYRDRVIDEAWSALRTFDLATHGPQLAYAHYGVRTAAFSSLRMELFEEMTAYQEPLGDALSGRARLMFEVNGSIGALMAGDIGSARRHLEIAGRIADDLQEPLGRCLFHFQGAALNITLGSLDAAQDHLGRLTHHAGQVDNPEPAMWHAACQIMAAFQTGTYDQLVDLAATAVHLYPDLTVWKTVAAAAHAAAGEAEEATALLEEAATTDFGMSPPDILTGGSLGWAALAAIRLDSPHRHRLLHLLDAYPGPLTASSSTNIGPPSYFAGLICRHDGDLDGAVDRLTQASEVAASLSTRGYEALAQAALAATLHARNRGADRSTARDLADRAMVIAAEIGLGGVEEDCADLVG